MGKIEERRSIKYIEVIRIIAVFMVIVNHTDLNWAYYHNTQNGLTFISSLLTTLIVKADVPLFLMVSGALLLDRDESIKNIWINRILRMVIVLVIFSLAQYVFHNIRYGLNISIQDFLIRLIQGNIQETYWFIYLYIGFLIVLPIYRAFIKGTSLYGYLYIIIIAIFLELYRTISIFTKINISSSLIDVLQICCSYSFYWIMGYFINKNIDLIKEKSKMVRVFCIFIILYEIILPFLVSCICFYKNNVFLDELILNTGKLWPVVAYILIMGVYGKRSTWIVNIGKYTFSIYLLEQFVRAILLPVHKCLINKIPGVINSLIYALLTFIIALAISYLLKKIPIIKKIL